MFALLLLLQSLHAAPKYSHSCFNLDGSISFSYPREEIAGHSYGYTFDNPDVLCQHFGQEAAVEVQTKTALWGTYDSVHLDSSGQISVPRPAETIARRLLCYSVRLLGF